MNLIFSKLLGLLGAEKLFLMAWNAILPTLLAKAKKSEYTWDETSLLFINDLVLLYTGKKSPTDFPDVKKPDALVAIEAEFKTIA